MLDFSIKPDVMSIAKSKRKFIYFGILLLIINIYFIVQYFNLMLDSQSIGYYLCVLALVNLPIFIVSIVLLLVPTIHRKHYSHICYGFNRDNLVISGENINISNITGFEEFEFSSGFYKIFIYTMNRCYELQGISSEDLAKFNDWFQKKKM